MEPFKGFPNPSVGPGGQEEQLVRLAGVFFLWLWCRSSTRIKPHQILTIESYPELVMSCVLLASEYFTFPHLSPRP